MALKLYVGVHTDGEVPDRTGNCLPHVIAETSMIVHVFHHDDPDGFGAAFAAHRRYPAAEFHPVEYNHGLPTVKAEPDDQVFFLDYTPEPAVVLPLLEAGAAVGILDHHRTGEKRLIRILEEIERRPAGSCATNKTDQTQALVGARLANQETSALLFARLDKNHSAAVLSWQHFHDDPVPPLLQYVEDYDLWKWELPDSRQINAALRSYPRTFEQWQELCRVLEGEAEPSGLPLSLEGTVILRHIDRRVERACRNVEMYKLLDCTEPVPLVLSTHYASEIGEHLLNRFQDRPLVAVAKPVSAREWIVSLRSREGFKAHRVAECYDGGGHDRAAGFRINPGWLRRW